MRIIKNILILFAVSNTLTCLAQRGIDGGKTVSAANTIVNEYTTLTADVGAGDSILMVAASGLNANNRFGPTSPTNSLQPGDLLMIIQMQGATINGTLTGGSPATFGMPNDNTWGSVTSPNNTGNFEFVQVKTVISTTSIKIDCQLLKSYTSAGKVQVIRVPRYSTLLIQAAGVLTCQSWTGTTGGVLAVEVYGNTTILAGGKINTTGTGFRGGALFTPSATRTTTSIISCISLNVGTNKGEGIAGFTTDYTPFGGQYCRGAAANAGGGGNIWNCGGGGGANAGLIASWTGQGNPNNSLAGWTLAWEKELVGFSGSTSSGGGRGGYSFSDTDKDATLLGPGTLGFTNLWGGSYRYNLGGLGGRPLDYSTGKIFLGGGGGAGEQDNNQGGAGGAGGGIVYFTSYGTITGSGNDSIISNGNNGGNTLNTGASTGIDAAGGAGGGGAIIINSVGLVSGVFVKANGGKGGDQLKNAVVSLLQAEGPGGGGGGGYIGVTNGPAAASQQSLGGTNGISQSAHITEFLPNGATMGGAGLINQTILRVDTITVANTTICSGNTATLTATLNGGIAATLQWYAASTGGTPLGFGTTFTTPTLSSTTTYYIGFCPGNYRKPVVVTVNTSPTASNAGPNQSLCSTSATLAGNTAIAGTGTWTLISGAGTITTPSSPTSTVTGLGVGANIFQWTIANPPCGTSSTQVTITNTGGPTTSLAGSNQTVCGTTATLAGNTPTTGTGLWTLVSGTGVITTPTSPTSGITGLSVGANVFQWTISSMPCTASSSTVTITGVAAPTVANAGPNQTICGTTATLAGNVATTGTGTWTLVSGSGTITTPTSPTSGVTGLGIGANVFQWTISNAPCIASTATITITASTTSDATISSVAPICLGTAAFNMSAVTAGGTWTGTGITSGALGTFDPATAGLGTFTITYTITGTCGNIDTALVTVTPNANATITPSTILCLSAAPVNLTAATAGGIWSGTGITSGASGTFDPATAGIGSHLITYSIAGICGGTDTVMVTVNSSSDATITQPASICAGTAPFNLTAATAGGTWTGTGITSGASGTFNPATAGIGTHIITYSISGICAAVDTVSITVTSAANATINSVTPMCANATAFNLTAATSGGTWSGTGITDAVNGTFNPALATAGTNTVTYSIPGACGDTATQTITVNALPTPTFTSNVTSGCAPVCVTFNESAANTCNSVLYNFGDGNTSTSSSPTNCYSNAGTYSVTITCTDANNCVGTNTITNMITVSPTPIASFTVSPSGVLPTNTIVTVADLSTNGGISFWNFDDLSSGASNTSILTSDTHTFTAEGTYCITLISSNLSGCVDTTSECITIANDATILIPNVFTPNNDGDNDLFYFTSTSVKELTCTIYDRWGLKIFTFIASNDAKTGWDGRTTSGLIATDGVYYFIMKAETLNKKTIEEKGFIQLLKEK